MPLRANKANVQDSEFGNGRIKTCYGDTNSSTGEELVLKWGDIYNMFRDEKYPEVEEEDKDVFTNIKRSGLHRVAARPPVFPCADAISWIISRVKVDNRRVMAIDDEQFVGSFRPEHLEVYYKLPRSEVAFTTKWLERQTHDVHAIMKSWWVRTKRFRSKPFTSTYPTASLRVPYKLVAMMMSRLFGDPDAREFQQTWVELMYEVCNKGTIFNWSGILSGAMVVAVTRARTVREGNEVSHFYMSSYFLDVICATNPFPGLHWMWTPREPPVHIYCSLLWEHRFKNDYQMICDQFIRPLYKILHQAEAPCISDSACDLLVDIGDWYLTPDFSYLRIYGCSKPPHLFPLYITDMMVLLEIAYQNFVSGVSHTLALNRKSPWPPLPLMVGHYWIERANDAEVEGSSLDAFRLPTGSFKWHDPCQVVAKHCSKLVFKYPYNNQEETEECYRRVRTLGDLTKKMKKGSKEEHEKTYKARQDAEERQDALRVDQRKTMLDLVENKIKERVARGNKHQDKGHEDQDNEENNEKEEEADKRRSEEEKRQKEEDEKRIQEEEKRKKDEEADNKRKEEEQRRKDEEEAKRRREEEKMKDEEAKKRRNEEEKRQKEEDEKRRHDEEKRLKEEEAEKKRQEEETRQKEEQAAGKKRQVEESHNGEDESMLEDIPGLDLLGSTSSDNPSLPQVTGGHLPLAEQGFGDSMPIESHLFFDRTKTMIVRRGHKKLKGNDMSGQPTTTVATEVPVFTHVTQNPLLIASAGVAFMQASKCNTINLVQQRDALTKDLDDMRAENMSLRNKNEVLQEELDKLQHNKGDLIEFKDFATSLFNEVVEEQDRVRLKMIRLQELITHLRGVKEKVEIQNLELEASRNCIQQVEDWQRENNEPLDGIPRLNTYEIKSYQIALRYARDTGCQLEKDIINTLTICQNNYEATNKMMDISGLPDFGRFEHWKAPEVRLYEIEAMKKARVAYISDVKQISKQVMMDFISSPTTNLHLIKTHCGSLERNMKKSAEELINHTCTLYNIQGKIQEEIKRYHNDWEQARSKKDAPPSGSQ